MSKQSRLIIRLLLTYFVIYEVIAFGIVVIGGYGADMRERVGALWDYTRFAFVPIFGEWTLLCAVVAASLTVVLEGVLVGVRRIRKSASSVD